mmetsp:Transcript_95153/g.268871  ORF Transcript_95153/g.268871 Transcript_95153/m.268871 type:complete len:395 (+) Transcript_95153:134-1318(+)
MPDPGFTEEQLAPGENLVSNDPFLTHTLPVARSSPFAEDPLTNVAEAVPERADVAEDPFLIRQQFSPLPLYRKRCDIREYIGEGDPDRKKATLRFLILLPWMTFAWVLMLWLLLRHYSLTVTLLLTVLIGLAAFGCIVAWHRGITTKRRLPLLAIGILTFAAVVFGVIFGDWGWNSVWRQYWWTRTGHRYQRNDASTVAGARTDASVVGFWNSDTESTMADTSVDVFQSAGYRNGHIYCVAPILSPPVVASGHPLVNYWAIGVDCCENLGSFTCDDSRNYLGGYGVVMLEGGYPCPECGAENFRNAVKKAESAFGLNTAAGALKVRWVRDPASVEWQLTWRAFVFLLLCCVLAFPVCFACAWVFWYKGIGYVVTPARQFESDHLPMQKHSTQQL